jgi:AcrR family transcriptional regulator
MRRLTAAALHRESVLDGAEALVLAKGPGGLTLRALGEQLGTSAMTPYGQFASKAVLMTALRRRIEGELDRRLAEAIERPGDWMMRLQALGAAYAGFARDQKPLFTLIAAGGAGASHRPPRPLIVLAEELSGASPEAARAAAAMLWAAIHGWLTLDAARPGALGPAADLATLLATVGRGLTQPGAPDAH